jgi:hypothetical protein
MRSNQWKIFTTGRFIAWVWLSLLSLSVNSATLPVTLSGSISSCLTLGHDPNNRYLYFSASPSAVCSSYGSGLTPQIATNANNSYYCKTPTGSGNFPNCSRFFGNTLTQAQHDAVIASGKTLTDSPFNPPPQPTIIQDCPPGLYKNASNTCVAQIKCHVTNPTGVNPYFDVNTGTCKEPDLPSLVCGSPNTIACEPLNDCIKTTEFCSNSTADKAAHDVLQLPTTSQQKQNAQAAATSAAASASAAVTIKSTVDADVVTKQNTYNSASTAYNNNPSPQTLAPMATALNDFQTATSTSSKVATSSTAAGTASNNANSANNAIDLNNTKQGIAENKATEAQYWKNEAARALAAAGRGTTYIINNYPSPGITGDNEGNDNNGSVTDADNDGTPDGIDKNDIDTGQGPNFGNTSSITESNQALIAALNDYPAIDGINQIRAMNFGGSGNCPGLVLDTGTSWFGSLSTNAHCEIIANHSTLIQNMSRVVWVIAALFLFFSA